MPFPVQASAPFPRPLYSVFIYRIARAKVCLLRKEVEFDNTLKKLPIFLKF